MSEIPTEVVLTALVVAVLAAVFSPAMVGRLLSPETRARVEVGTALVLAPMLVGFAIWRAFLEAQSGDPWNAVGWGVFALMIGISGVRIAWRRLRAKVAAS